MPIPLAFADQISVLPQSEILGETSNGMRMHMAALILHWTRHVTGHNTRNGFPTHVILAKAPTSCIRYQNPTQVKNINKPLRRRTKNEAKTTKMTTVIRLNESPALDESDASLANQTDVKKAVMPSSVPRLQSQDRCFHSKDYDAKVAETVKNYCDKYYGRDDGNAMSSSHK